MQVIGTGVGRTGTYSLKLAINQLGLGPCHHMEEVLHNIPVQVPIWSAVLNEGPDWQAIYSGYESAVDWPTAAFFSRIDRGVPDCQVRVNSSQPGILGRQFWRNDISTTSRTGSGAARKKGLAGNGRTRDLQNELSRRSRP